MRHILIIDDEKNLANLLKEILIEHIDNVKVITFTNAEDALIFFNNNVIDLIISDINLPGLSGIKACQKIRANKQNIFIPVIMVTGLRTGDNLKVKALEAGANIFLQKPLSSGEVIAHVKSMLHLRELNLQLACERDNLKTRLEDNTKQLEEKKEIYNIILNTTNEGIWQWDLETDKIKLSQHFFDEMGYPKKKTNFSFLELKKIIHPDDITRFEQHVDEYLSGIVSKFQVEIRVKNNNNRYIWMLYRAQSLKDAENKPYMLVGSQLNIQKQKNLENKLRNLALHDKLTGLPNRVLMHERFKQIIEQAFRLNYYVGILFVDIDNFKDFNDKFNHDFGDKVLIEFAKRLESAVRKVDTVARYAGDEFVVVLAHLTSTENLKQILERMQKQISHPFKINGEKVKVSVSIGVSLYPTMSDNLSELINQADIAMYDAKENGKNQYFLHPEIRAVFEV